MITESAKTMPTWSVPDFASLNAQKKAAELIQNGYARIMRGLNAEDPDISSMEPPHAPIEALVPPPPTIYHSTGTQTQPLCDGYQFKEIFGREPTRYDLERSIGTAGIGHYSDAFEVKPHELLYGAPFLATRRIEPETDYNDSMFQSACFEDSNKALTRAKARASMTANKYRHVAEKAGYKVWAESKNERVLHSEQFPTTIQLDSLGNSREAVAEGAFLPNLYGEEIRTDNLPIGEITGAQLPVSRKDHCPKQKIANYTDSSTAQHLTPTTTLALISRDSILRPIAVLAPSMRGADPDGDSMESYSLVPSIPGDEGSYNEGETLGRQLDNTREPNDDINSAVFVARDTTESSKPVLPQASVKSLSLSRKRNIAPDTDKSPQQRVSKRTKIPGPHKAESLFAAEILANKDCNDVNSNNIHGGFKGDLWKEPCIGIEGQSEPMDQVVKCGMLRSSRTTIERRGIPSKEAIKEDSVNTSGVNYKWIIHSESEYQTRPILNERRKRQDRDLQEAQGLGSPSQPITRSKGIEQQPSSLSKKHSPNSQPLRLGNLEDDLAQTHDARNSYQEPEFTIVKQNAESIEHNHYSKGNLPINKTAQSYKDSKYEVISARKAEKSHPFEHARQDDEHETWHAQEQLKKETDYPKAIHEVHRSYQKFDKATIITELKPHRPFRAEIQRYNPRERMRMMAERRKSCGNNTTPSGKGRL